MEHNKQNIPNISMPVLLAANSTKKANDLVVKYGFPKPRNQQELIIRLSQLLKSGEEDVAKDFAEIHPHKDFIIGTIGTKIIGQEAANKEMGIKEEVKKEEVNNNEKESNKPICPGKGLNLNKQNMNDQEIKQSLEHSMTEVAEKSSNIDGNYKVLPKEWIPVVVVAGSFLLAIAIFVSIKSK